MECARGSLGGSGHRDTNAAEVTRVHIRKSLQYHMACDCQCTKRRGQEGPPALSFKHRYMQNPLRGKLVHESNSRTSTLLSEIAVWATGRQARYGYPSVCPICLSHQCSTSLPHHVPLCQLPLRKQLPGSTYLQPSFDVPEAQVPA